MASGEVTAGRPARAGKVGTRKEDWIGEQLRHVYDEALGEAIPEEMLALLRQLEDEAGSDNGEEQP